MKLIQLFEAISPVVYHKTTIKNAYNILKEDRFKLVTSIGVSPEGVLDSKRKKFDSYYMSTARVRSNTFFDYEYSTVVFNLNGRKLSQRYHGKPVNYWGADMFKFESEDRIYSSNPYIKPASKYIEEIHVYISDNDVIISSLSKPFGKLLLMAKKKRIPLYLYHQYSDFIKQHKSRSEDPLLWLKNNKRRGSVLDSKAFYDEKPFSGWIELYYTPVENRHKLSVRAKDKLYNLRMYFYDTVRWLSNDIASYRREAEETGLNSLMKIFRKERIKDPKIFLQMILEKWEM